MRHVHPSFQANRISGHWKCTTSVCELSDPRGVTALCERYPFWTRPIEMHLPRFRHSGSGCQSRCGIHCYIRTQIALQFFLSRAIRLAAELRLLIRDLLLARPPNSLEALSQNGVRVVVCRVRPVRVHGGQILNLQLDEGGGKLGSIAKIK